MSEHVAVREEIERLYETLSPQLRQAARFVLDRPEDVALRSMRQLAGEAGVTPATMVRLAKALGYDGYENFRQPFQQRLRDPDGAYAARALAMQSERAGDSGDPAIQMLLRQQDMEAENLRRSFDQIGPERLTACAGILSAAPRLHVVGLRSCYSVAFLFHYSVRLFSSSSHLIDGHAGTLPDAVRNIADGDAVLAISFAPYTRETVEIVDYAAASGASVVAITDSEVSPLVVPAAETLLVRTDSPSFLHSMLGAISVVQALAAAMVLRQGKPALAGLADSEAHLLRFKAYKESPASRYMGGYAGRNPGRRTRRPAAAKKVTPAGKALGGKQRR